MKIQNVNIGGGLFRMEVTPSFWGENLSEIPTFIMDSFARDVVKNMNKDTTSQPRDARGRFVASPKPCVPCGEPHGFDAHIDRPLRENYCGWGADSDFQSDMRKYRKAEEAVKACDWPCREPMKSVPNYVHLEAERCQRPKHTTNSCNCGMTKAQKINKLVRVLEEIL